MTKRKNKVLIITGGRTEDAFISDLTAKEKYSMIIAADRGLVSAKRLKLMPDFIVGDFDSVPEAVLKLYRDRSIPIRTFPKEKDKTDTELAIELALMNGAGAIDIVGATGSRLDHVLANVHLLLLPMRLKVDARILDAHNKLYLKQESFCLSKNEQFGSYVSLLPFSEKVSGLTLRGFKYPLDGVVLAAGSSLGISNEIREETAQVLFSEGILLVIEARD